MASSRTGKLVKQRVEIDNHLLERGAPEAVSAPALVDSAAEKGNMRRRCDSASDFKPERLFFLDN